MIYDDSKLWNDSKDKPMPRRKRGRHGRRRHPLENYAELTGEEKFPDRYIKMIFDAQLAEKGGPLRRNLDWVERYPTLPGLLAELSGRDWHCIQIGGQLILYSGQHEPKTLL